MASPTSVIRRYTPPTCTLEISAKQSPLSRWMGQNVLKHLRFKLSFDDPRLNETDWITVTGNRAQLQALSDAVTGYVQKFLSQSRETLSQSSGQATAIGSEPATDFIPETNPAGIYLQPKGILSHELYLGSLATEQSGPAIRLSAVQLADLASALDEYGTDVTALPNLERSRWINTTPAWGTIAAAAVVTLGLAGFLAKVLEPSNPQTATTASQGASSNDQRLSVQPLPNNASPSPLGPLTSVPLPLTSASPSPSATTAAKPTTPQAPGAPAQLPNLTISQQPTVDAPPPQLNLPVREVPVSSIPNQAAGAPAPSNPAASNAASNPSGTATQAGTTAARKAPKPSTADNEPASDVAIASAPQAERSAPQASAPASSSAGNSRSASSVSQVAEVKSFFESQWQPPKELTESIEYRLVLAPDGTLQTFTPLGRTADLFLDRTPMPFTGQKFVSPVKGGGNPTIRLVLSPDGKVQTFLESP